MLCIRIWVRAQLGDASVSSGIDWGHSLGSLWEGLEDVWQDGQQTELDEPVDWSSCLWCLQHSGRRVVRLLIWWLGAPGASVSESKAELCSLLHHITLLSLNSLIKAVTDSLSFQGRECRPYLRKEECRIICSHSWKTPHLHTRNCYALERGHL